jgi:hypothetical protein
VPTRLAPERQLDAAALRETLREIVRELEPVVESRMDTSLANVLHFTCKQCGNPSAANAEVVQERRRAVCIGCGVEYAAVQGDEGLALRLVATNVACARCGAANIIESRLLEVGKSFRCVDCGVLHEIVGQEWAYGVVDDTGE